MRDSRDQNKATRKSIFGIIGALLITILFTGCGNNTEQSNTEQSKTISKVEDNAETTKAIVEDAEDENTEDTITLEDHGPSSGQVLFDQNNLKITSEGVALENGYVELYMLVQNDSDENLSISLFIPKINGDDTLDRGIGGQNIDKKKTEHLSFGLEMMNGDEIESLDSISDITFSFCIEDGDSYELADDFLNSDDVTITINDSVQDGSEEEATESDDSVEDAPSVEEAYNTAISLTRDDVDMRETSSGMPFATFDNVVILDQDEIDWVNSSSNPSHVFNQNALYNAMAQSVDYYFDNGQDFSSWAVRYCAPFNGMDMADVMFGTEEDAEENLRRTGAFFNSSYPAANFLGYMENMDCAECNYDTSAGKYSLTIDISKAVSDIGISDRAFGYTLAMLEAYQFNNDAVSFSSDGTVSIGLTNDKIASQMQALGYN